jgi:cell division protease FtsH
VKNQKFLRGPMVWIAILLVALFATVSLVQGANAPQVLSVNEFVELAEAGVFDVEIDGAEDEFLQTFGLQSSTIAGSYIPPDATDDTPVLFTVTYSGVVNGPKLSALFDQGLLTMQADNEQSGAVAQVLFTLLPFVLIFGLFFFLMQQMQGGGGGGVMKFGKAKAKMVTKDTPKVTFDDVAGAEEAKEELREIKDFLENPAKFQAMGAKIPKGALLFGPPGTGKTLLARAVAGEAGVPFFSISGSDFVEMFVGVGASRVRDLFEQAKANAPSIIFIDEIDAVGRHRGAGMGGGHDEREQTLNQLLVEMDGFDQRQAIILIAATNRPDILDPALLRPGRFDRQITVDRPDLVGREAILKIHAKGKPLADDIDLRVLARTTPGFTGADLANLVNEAALLAARFGKKEISQAELSEAIDRVIAGPERKSKLMSERERSITAYHEAGHAIVGHALPNGDPIHKITIIPRGRAGGFTMSLPAEDRSYNTRAELIDRMAMMLGGRVAEELKIGDYTTGASNDIEKATNLAREMVTQFGMSEKLGPIQLGVKEGQPFLGRDMGHTPDYGGGTAGQIDLEIRQLIDEAHDEALEILVANYDVLQSLAETLLEVESLDGEALQAVLAPTRSRPSRAAEAPFELPADQIMERLRRLGRVHPDASGRTGSSLTTASAGRATVRRVVRPRTSEDGS